MTITIDTKTSPFQATWADFNSVIPNMKEKGYSPLLLQAKQRFWEAFGETDQKISQLVDTYLADPSISYEERYLGLALRRRSLYASRGDLPIPAAGDLFFSTTGNGILYLALMVAEPARGQRSKKAKPDSYLEVGYVGEETDSQCLDNFITSVAEILSGLGISPDWSPSRPSNRQFTELASSEETRFLPATDVSEGDLELARHLEDQSVRSLALVVKRSGGILAIDLAKKAGTKPEEARRVTEHLTKVGLLAQEYVVICRKTSNQINRVKSREMIEKMAKMGILCSCGRPVSEERVEELFTPTPQLQQMLDQSYWMTANLLQVLGQLNIPQDRILLNLSDGAEEIDAFVDLDGTLLMFELKDSEFSMGHAYPFSGRIGLYKPEVAIIVSTSRVAPEVKEYFEQVKPSAEIVYVSQLDHLAPTLSDITRRVRSKRAQQVLSRFDPMATVMMPLSNVLAAKIGIEPEPAVRGRRR